jgi:hypothetical protein
MAFTTRETEQRADVSSARSRLSETASSMRKRRIWPLGIHKRQTHQCRGVEYTCCGSGLSHLARARRATCDLFGRVLRCRVVRRVSGLYTAMQPFCGSQTVVLVVVDISVSDMCNSAQMSDTPLFASVRLRLSTRNRLARGGDFLWIVQIALRVHNCVIWKKIAVHDSTVILGFKVMHCMPKLTQDTILRSRACNACQH